MDGKVDPTPEKCAGAKLFAAVHESAHGTKCECRFVPLTTALELTPDSTRIAAARSYERGVERYYL
jgi:hypothetical protein